MGASRLAFRRAGSLSVSWYCILARSSVCHQRPGVDLNRRLRLSGKQVIIVVTLSLAAGPLTVALGLLRHASLSSGIKDAEGISRIVGAPSHTLLSYSEVLSVSKSLHATVPGTAAGASITVDLGIGEVQRPLSAALVTGNYFQFLGVDMRLGRAATSYETDAVVVISNSMWQSQLGSDPSVIGKSIQLDGEPFTVVGVADREYLGLELGTSVNAWIPVSFHRLLHEAPSITSWDDFRFTMLARCRPGFSLDQLRSQLEAVAHELDAERSAGGAPRLFRAEPLEGKRKNTDNETGVRGLEIAMWIVAAALLAIAAFNVAGILLVREINAEHDTAVRLALGSSYRRLLVQGLVESALLTLVSLAMSALIANWFFSWLRSAADLPLTGWMGSWRFLAWITFIAIVLSCALTALPAAYWRGINLGAALTSGGRSEQAHARDSRNTLVALQVALSFVVVATAVAAGRTIQQLRRVNPGFDTAGLLVSSYDLRRVATTRQMLTPAKRELVATVVRIPGVLAAGLGLTPLLFNGMSLSSSVIVAQNVPQPVSIDVVGPGYFGALGVEIVQGRDFDYNDVTGAPHRVLINEAMAARFWRAQDPVGQQFHLVEYSGSRTEEEVIGVVRDFNSDYVGLSKTPRIFSSALQSPVLLGNLYIRVDPKAGSVGAIRVALSDFLHLRPSEIDIRTVDEVREESMYFVKNTYHVAIAMSLLSLTIASVGVFAMLSFLVTRRTREFGIRLALGATPRQVLWMVAKDALRPAIAGLLAAVPLTIGILRLMRVVLYRTSSLQSTVLLGAAVALLIVVAIGGMWPALRAVRSDPMNCIRVT